MCTEEHFSRKFYENHGSFHKTEINSKQKSSWNIIFIYKPFSQKMFASPYDLLAKIAFLGSHQDFKVNTFQVEVKIIY